MSATNRGAVRVQNDFYPTPGYTIDSLFEFINWDRVKSFCEPCKGSGAILDKVPQLPVMSYCELSEGVDYLTYPYAVDKFDLIVTNPPFSLAAEFLVKSLREARCVAYLLRLNYLGSQKRVQLWDEIGTPNKLLVLSKRPKFINNQADATEYAWFCWDRENIIDLSPGVHVLR
jgi:hypothetical protein